MQTLLWRFACVGCLEQLVGCGCNQHWRLAEVAVGEVFDLHRRQAGDDLGQELGKLRCVGVDALLDVHAFQAS